MGIESFLGYNQESARDRTDFVGGHPAAEALHIEPYLNGGSPEDLDEDGEEPLPDEERPAFPPESEEGYK